MKSFLIGGLFVFATFFPIVFVPLLALTLVVIALVAPHVLKNGMGWIDDPKKELHKTT